MLLPERLEFAILRFSLVSNVIALPVLPGFAVSPSAQPPVPPIKVEEEISSNDEFLVTSASPPSLPFKPNCAPFDPLPPDKFVREMVMYDD